MHFYLTTSLNTWLECITLLVKCVQGTAASSGVKKRLYLRKTDDIEELEITGQQRYQEVFLRVSC